MNHYTIGFPTTRDVAIKTPQGDAVHVPLDEHGKLVCTVSGRETEDGPFVVVAPIDIKLDVGDTLIPFGGVGRVTAVETKRFGSWYDSVWQLR